MCRYHRKPPFLALIITHFAMQKVPRRNQAHDWVEVIKKTRHGTIKSMHVIKAKSAPMKPPPRPKKPLPSRRSTSVNPATEVHGWDDPWEDDDRPIMNLFDPVPLQELQRAIASDSKVWNLNQLQFTHSLTQFLPQDQHSYLKEFLAQRSDILFAILRQECLADNGVCWDCQSDHGLWRCLDCQSKHAVCRDCLRTSHHLHPFHRIQFWTGTHYEGDWLYNLAVTVNLGHRGACCPGKSGGFKQVKYEPAAKKVTALKDFVDPYASPSRLCDIPNDSNRLTIIHSNGIHQVWIRRCDCVKDKDIQHFIEQALFPSTFHRTKTAFTFSLLDDFRKANLNCKTTAYSYWRKLRRLNSEFFSDACPVSHRHHPYSAQCSSSIGPIP